MSFYDYMESRALTAPFYALTDHDAGIRRAEDGTLYDLEGNLLRSA